MTAPIRKSEKCTGCGACLQICPRGCIRWEEGELGFRYPVIDRAVCTDCGLCGSVCQIGREARTPSGQQVFAAVHRDREIVKESASGGAFSAIAGYILNRDGVVYGCCLDEDMNAVHIRADSEEKLCGIRGSKYIQSDTAYTFRAAEADLQKGKKVLYTGTPCQIAGLYRFLGKDYENLVTVDVICHGVGSQAYFHKFLTYVESRYGAISELRFRSKKFAGWSCNGDIVVIDKKQKRVEKRFYHYKNYYYDYFLRGYIYRKSCYLCPYANRNRQGDFTVGDFWGVERYHLHLPTFEGCSLLLLNTEKAKRIFRELKEIETAEVTMEQAMAGNAQLAAPCREPAVRKELAGQYEVWDGKEIDGAFRRRNRLRIAAGFIKARVPYRMKAVLRGRM